MSTPLQTGQADMYWTRTTGDIPTYELRSDPAYYVEKWGLGSWAAYHGDERIGEPGSCGDKGEAQQAAEAQYRAEGSVQHATWVFENYQIELEAAGAGATEQLRELVRRSGAARAEAVAARADADDEHELEGRVS